MVIFGAEDHPRLKVTVFNTLLFAELKDNPRQMPVPYTGTGTLNGAG
jgi:hypothetical protein